MSTIPTISDVLARRFKAAWLDYESHRQHGEPDLELAALRRWGRLRIALENALIGESSAPAASPAPAPAAEIHRLDDGGALVSIPLPTSVRHDLDSAPWRLHLDVRVGSTFGILACAAVDRDAELQRIGQAGLFTLARDLGPLANFTRQRLDLIHLALHPAAWSAYQLAAEHSGQPAPRLLAAVLVRVWAETLNVPPILFQQPAAVLAA